VIGAMLIGDDKKKIGSRDHMRMLFAFYLSSNLSIIQNLLRATATGGLLRFLHDSRNTEGGRTHDQ
jgi:hypothetical protein